MINTKEMPPYMITLYETLINKWHKKSNQNLIIHKAARKIRQSSLLVMSQKILDLSKKLEQKKIQDEEKKILEQLEIAKPEIPTILQNQNELQQKHEQRELSEIEKELGVWLHKFSDVRKDEIGFFILKKDNPAGKKMKPGQLLADLAINTTPYWKITSIEQNRINLEPIGNNPFLTGIGAGGAKLTNYDVSVFTGDAEKKRVEQIINKMQKGNATIDDVIYLLDGTVPTQMGPNGAQGGWYNLDDTRSNRGGMKNMTPKQIMVSDAKKLVGWGFTGIPIKALNGEMEPKTWESWLENNNREEVYIPKNLENYID